MWLGIEAIALYDQKDRKKREWIECGLGNTSRVTQTHFREFGRRGRVDNRVKFRYRVDLLSLLEE